MEKIVVIAIIAIAGIYVTRVFYFKFRQGKSYDGNPCCSGCSCSNTCGHKDVNENCTK